MEHVDTRYVMRSRRAQSFLGMISSSFVQQNWHCK
jgi:hypothetical protein